MPWYWIVLISIGGINLAIAAYCTILFWSEGYYVNIFARGYGKTNWGMAILAFVVMLIAGLPIAIFGIIILIIEG